MISSIRLFGTAILLDWLLLVITVPLSKLVMSILLPSSLAVSPLMLMTYGMVVFCVVTVILLYLLWFFESVYAHLFSFWQLVITMFLMITVYLYLHRGF